VSQAKSSNTLRAYQSDWADFSIWCTDRDLVAMPATPKTTAFYLTSLIKPGKKTSTLQRRISAISQAHLAANQENLTHSAVVHAIMAGFRRQC